MQKSNVEDFIRSALLLNCLQHTLASLELGCKHLSQTPSKQYGEFALAIAHIKELLLQNTVSSTLDDIGDSVLGLKNASLNSFCFQKTVLESFRLSLYPKIEKMLSSRCHDVYVHIEPYSVTSEVHVSNLPFCLKALQNELFQLRDKVDAQIYDSIGYQIKMMSITTKCCELLETTLEAYKRNDAYDSTSLKVQWLRAVSRTVQLKATLLRKKLALESYPRRKIEILKRIRRNLAKRQHLAILDQEQSTIKLGLYMDADIDFQLIAQQYNAVLQKNQEKANWIKSLNI